MENIGVISTQLQLHLGENTANHTNTQSHDMGLIVGLDVVNVDNYNLEISHQRVQL